MSSFYCKDETFSSVARVGMRWGMEEANSLYREAANLNLTALEERYEDYRNSEDAKKLREQITRCGYVENPERTRIQDVFAAQCWLYQCDQGKLADSAIYRKWEYAIRRETIFLANAVISPTRERIKDYSDARDELERYCEFHGIEMPWE